MQSILFLIKQQINVLSLLLVLLMMAFVANRFHKKKATILFLSVFSFIFLLSSTAYLPQYLAAQLEKEYSPFTIGSVPNRNDKVLIHVLGSGYNVDERLPATAQLGLVALGRLTEAVRIHHLLPNSIVVCSGNSMHGLETQAEVTRRAALLLGVDSAHLATLNMPSTTLEESKALAAAFGTAYKVIIATDALHMPRAMRFFKNQGFTPVPAPTNYKLPNGYQSSTLKWWPSINNMTLADEVLHEYLGNLKAAL